MSEPFSLFLFSTDSEQIQRCIAAGVAGIIVDWERIGKRQRQVFADTQINMDTLEDLERVRAATRARVICRINGFHEATREEVRMCKDSGADEILLPMVRALGEVEDVLAYANGEIEVGILVETLEAYDIAEALSALPLSRVYVGLNDLAIARGTTNIFSALFDGMLDSIRARVSVPFGFAGLTLPDRGSPIPCRLLIGEMSRLGSQFSFLRRSFQRDIREHDPALEIPHILAALAEARARSPEEAQRDRAALLEAIRTQARETLLGSGRREQSDD
jgi:hypothetical protein